MQVSTALPESEFPGSDVTADAVAIVSWREGKEVKRKLLQPGRYLIGDSAFAEIRVGFGGTISAALFVTADTIHLRILAAHPGVFIDGRRLAAGENVLVGDILQCAVGRHSITVAAASVSRTPSHLISHDEAGNNRQTKLKQRASANANQVELGDLLANPDALKRTLARMLLDQLNIASVNLAKVDSPEVRETARLRLRKLVSDIEFPAGFPLTRTEIEEQVFNEVLGLGPLEDLLSDSKISEIMVNRRDQIYVERGGRLTLSTVHFSSDQALMNVIERIVSTVGRRIDTSSPIVDARLLDGSRVNAIIPPLALNGPALTIRRFSKTPISVDTLIQFGSLNQQMADFLKHTVEEHKNIIVSGGTGSGKTTLLGALSSFIPEGERIVTVEDAAELQLQQPHVVRLESRPPNLEGQGAIAIRDLVKNTLRMRPDRIIVGECRSGEALDMLQAMNTGHDGSMTTAHANSPEDMLRRLETMVMMAGMDLPLRAIREQIASALNVIVQQTRQKTGRRLVTEIAWIKGIDKTDGSYVTEVLFSRDRDSKVVMHRAAIERFIEVEEISPLSFDSHPSQEERS